MLIKDIKGVGKKTLESLLEKGIHDIPSLIYYFPKNYKEYKLTNFSKDTSFNVKAFVIDNPQVNEYSKNKVLSLEVMIEDTKYKVNIFNQEYLKHTLSIGDEIVVCGSYNHDYKNITASNIMKLDSYKEGIVPEYNILNVSNKLYQNIVLEALKYYDPKYLVIPKQYFEKHKYKTGKELILAIHNPKSLSEAKEAIEAIKYYELLSFNIKMSLIRENIKKEKKIPKDYNIDVIKDFITLSLPFEFTIDQKNATNTIFKYLKSDIPLNMLLEGDTGSGKTIVALLSSYAVYTSGYQVLMMVPTEALALQHYNTFLSYLERYGVNIKLLTSSLKASSRKEVLDGLKDGSIDIVIGTHSLLNKEVEFKKLGFVICDEQHKFGVIQRREIREKGKNVDTLYLTATPIPRSLALTYFNDLDIVKLRSKPSNRKNVITEIHTYKDYLDILNFIKSEIEDKHQVYFVSPIINEKEDSSLTSVLRIEKDLKTYFNDVKIGLLHGQLDNIEKDNVIKSFLNHEIDILVSTSVIEVGIDNKNATVMVVIDASSFGLAQLHQLRGRVGRSDLTSYCFLMIDDIKNKDKIKILEETNDGFLISEEDLRLRGPGDFLGTDQSGLSIFKFADLYNDKDLFEMAKEDSKELINNSEVRDYYLSNLNSNNFD